MDWLGTTLIDQRSCGEDVHTCRFERPKGYDFSSGQYFMLRLGGALARPFSHASAPGDSWIEVTTRFSGSEFKSVLALLDPGSGVAISPSLGRLHVPKDAGKVTFLVGGIGITPVRSIVRDAVQRSIGLAGMIVYGNRSPACVPYRAELDSYVSSGIRTVHVFEQRLEEQSAEEGLITPDLVRRYTDSASGLFVTTGPPVMVTAMERVMDDLGIPLARRLVERFNTT